MTITQTIKQTGSYPLSSSQSRIWFIENLDKNVTAYNIPLDFRIQGNLDTDLLQQSINLLIERHSSLRTIFPDINGAPVQKVLPAMPVSLEVINLENEKKEDLEQIIRQHSLEHGKYKFDIAKGPLFHFRLLVLGEQEYIFLLNFHHLISDATSVGIFLDELTSVYQSLVTGKPADLPSLLYNYQEYALEQKEWLKSDACREQLDYWKKELSGIPDLLKLPLDHHRPKIQTYNGTEYHFIIDGDLREKITALSQKHKTTLFIPLLTAFGVRNRAS